MDNNILIYKSKRKIGIIFLTGILLGVAGYLFIRYSNNPVIGWSFNILSVLCLIFGIGSWMDRKPVFDKLLKIRNNRRLENAIAHAVQNTVLRKKEYNEIMKRHNATHNELLKVIIKQKLKFKLFPFKLQYGNRNQLFHQVFVKKRKYDELVKDGDRDK